MSDRDADWKLHVENCRKQSAAMLDAAAAAASEAARTEFLELATAWLKLASEFTRLLDRI
jgi:hypothetical protein